MCGCILMRMAPKTDLKYPNWVIIYVLQPSPLTGKHNYLKWLQVAFKNGFHIRRLGEGIAWVGFVSKNLHSASFPCILQLLDWLNKPECDGTSFLDLKLSGKKSLNSKDFKDSVETFNWFNKKQHDPTKASLIKNQHQTSHDKLTYSQRLLYG